MIGIISKSYRAMEQRNTLTMASDECTQPHVRLQLINEKAALLIKDKATLQSAVESEL